MNPSEARLYQAFTIHPHTQQITLHIKNDFHTGYT